MRLESNGVPAQGEAFVADAIATDRNEPDTVVFGTGCNRTIRFGASGSREVRVTTPDREDRRASAIATGAEALRSDWTCTAYYPSPIFPPRVLTTRTTVASQDLSPIIFGARNTAYQCTMDVRVNAPDPACSKTQRVWSRQCINVEDAPR